MTATRVQLVRRIVVAIVVVALLAALFSMFFPVAATNLWLWVVGH